MESERDQETRRLFLDIMRSDDDRAKDALNFFVRAAYSEIFKANLGPEPPSARPSKRAPRARRRHPAGAHYSTDDLRQLLTGELPKKIAAVDDPEARFQMWAHIGHCDHCRGRLAVLLVGEP
jgi:hypothetical protein